MKFLKITRHNQLFFDGMKENPAQFVEPLKEHNEWLKKMKEEGKLIDAYFIPGDGRSFLIFECDNAQELDNLILKDPMELTFTAEMYPAIPLFDHIEDAFNAKIGK